MYDCDYVHNCSEAPRNPALAKEDVPMIGTWTDADGTSSAGVVGASRSVSTGGMVDKRLLTEGHLDEPRRLPDYTIRGHAKDTTRERNRFTYVNLR